MKSVAELEQGQGGSAGALIPQGRKPTVQEMQKARKLIAAALTEFEHYENLLWMGQEGEGARALAIQNMTMAVSYCGSIGLQVK